MSNQKDLSELTETELKSDGWRFTGSKGEPRWEKEIGPGHTSYFYGMPTGRKRNTSTSSTGTIQRVVLTRIGYKTIRNILREYEDGWELMVPLMVSRDGDTLTVHEGVNGYGSDMGYRTETSTQVRMDAGYALEQYRQENGIDHRLCGFLHTHPYGGNTTASGADEAVLKANTRKELGGICLGIISAPVIRGVETDWIENIAAYIAADGREHVYPVTIYPEAD
jgi:hypothetical protein